MDAMKVYVQGGSDKRPRPLTARGARTRADASRRMIHRPPAIRARAGAHLRGELELCRASRAGRESRRLSDLPSGSGAGRDRPRGGGDAPGLRERVPPPRQRVGLGAVRQPPHPPVPLSRLDLGSRRNLARWPRHSPARLGHIDRSNLGSIDLGVADRRAQRDVRPCPAGEPNWAGAPARKRTHPSEATAGLPAADATGFQCHQCEGCPGVGDMVLSISAY
jgi:hypothetical protein